MLGRLPSGVLRVSVVDRAGVERRALLPPTALHAPPQPLGVQGLSSLLVDTAWAQARCLPGLHEGSVLYRAVTTAEVAALSRRAVRPPLFKLPAPLIRPRNPG